MGDKVTVDNLTVLENSSTINTINNNFDELADEFDNVLYRDGSTDMSGTINMNSNRIINLEDAINPGDAVTFGQVTNGLTITYSPGEVVPTRFLMASIVSPSSGDIVLLNEEGRLGIFKFDNSDLSAEVTADPYEGIYVAPNTEDGSDGAWVRQRINTNVFRASWYGIRSSNSEANNTDIADSILDTNLPGCILLLMPKGIIPIRIRVPAVGGNMLSVLEIDGEIAPSTHFGTVPGYTMTTDGCILYSTAVAANTTSGGVIEVLPSGGTFSNIKVVVRNIAIRTYDNSQQHGIMGLRASQLHVENVAIDTGNWTTTAANPTNVSYGIRVPVVNNGAFTSIKNVTVSGFHVGMDVSEHVVGDNLVFAGCKYALEYLASFHASKLNRIGIYRCQNGIIVSGACVIDIDQVSFEHVNAASEPGSWQITVYDLIDTSNLASGTIRYHSILAGVGSNGAFTRNGGGHITVVPVGTSNSGTAQYSISSAVSLPSSVETLMTFSAGTDTNAIIRNTATPSQIFIKEIGLYEIHFSSSFDANATGIRRVRIYPSTADILGEEIRSGISGHKVSFSTRTIVRFPTTDNYVRVTAEQINDAASALNLLDTDYSGVLSITKLSG